MPASISISNLKFLLATALALAGPATVWASDKTLQPEEEDFTGTPFTEYGEFNEESDEISDTRFFQHGRFFGASLGLGFQEISGNRGILWQGGFPAVDFKVHYWFDFNVALDLNVYTSSHFFETSVDEGGASVLEHVDINMVRLGADIKYYFDTKNLTAAVSFANPYVLAGFGPYSKTETSSKDGTVETDSNVGLNLGAGLEFPIKHRKAYFTLEGKMHLVTFKDTYTDRFQSSKSAPLQDLTGQFFTATASLLFTW